MEATLLFISLLSQILATSKIPGMSKGEQGVKNHFKGINLLSCAEPLKQFWLFGVGFGQKIKVDPES